jgi:hypothetical protein
VWQLAVLFYIGEVTILAHATQWERIEMRVDADIKQMAKSTDKKASEIGILINASSLIHWLPPPSCGKKSPPASDYRATLSQ